MRKLASVVFAATALASVATAQFTCNLGQPLTSANQGNPNGGIYFDLNVTSTVTWNSITYVASDATPLNTSSSFNLYLKLGTYVGNVNANPGPWVLVGTTTPVVVNTGAATADTTVVGILQPAGANPGTITFAPGQYGIALQAVGHSWGYQNGTFTFPAPGGEFTITAGGASNAFLALPTFSPRTINGSIDYAPGGTPMAFAGETPYGEGCYGRYQSFYESMPNPSTNFDLANQSLLMTYNAGANTYDVSLGTTAVDLGVLTNPALAIGQSDNVTVQLANGIPIIYADSTGTGVAATDVDVSSDGYVSFVVGSNPGPGAAANNASVAAWLNGGPRVGCWHDMDPTAGGTVHYDFDLVNGAHVFTWNAVPSRAITASSNTIQLAFFPNGNIEMRFGTVGAGAGGAWESLVGYTRGNGAFDPGTIDLSSAAPFSTQWGDPVTPESNPLTLEVSAAPVVGTTVNMTTSNETSNPGIGILFLSGNQAIVPIDLIILGAPGCFANITTLDTGIAIGNFAPLGMTVSIPVPNNPTLVGDDFFAQSIMLDPAQNLFGMTTSNGVRLAFGLF